MDDSYVAGFFDGEGCISIYPKDGRMYVKFRLANECKEVLEEIKDFLGYGGFASERANQLSIAYYPNCLDFARRLSPYLIVKKEQMKTAIKQLEEDPKRKYCKKERN